MKNKQFIYTEEEAKKWIEYDVVLAPKKTAEDTSLSEGWYIDQVLEDVTDDLADRR